MLAQRLVPAAGAVFLVVVVVVFVRIGTRNLAKIQFWPQNLAPDPNWGAHVHLTRLPFIRGTGRTFQFDLARRIRPSHGTYACVCWRPIECRSYFFIEPIPVACRSLEPRSYRRASRARPADSRQKILQSRSKPVRFCDGQSPMLVILTRARSLRLGGGPRKTQKTATSRR